MIGERLRKARKAKGLKQSVLGHLIGVSPSEISQYENNKKFPRRDKLFKIMEVLEISSDYIFGTEVGVANNNTNYIVYLSSKDLQILSEIKKYKKLYHILCSERIEDAIYSWAKRFD